MLEILLIIYGITVFIAGSVFLPDMLNDRIPEGEKNIYIIGGILVFIPILNILIFGSDFLYRFLNIDLHNRDK